MEFIIVGIILGVGYPVYRFIKLYQSIKKANQDLEGKEILETVQYAFKTALFNAIMGGLSLSLVVASLESPFMVGGYIAISGLFVANVFDAYNFRRIFFTSNSFYFYNQSVRYKSIESIAPRKNSRKYVITTLQKQTFVIPKMVAEKLMIHAGKKGK